MTDQCVLVFVTTFCFFYMTLQTVPPGIPFQIRFQTYNEHKIECHMFIVRKHDFACMVITYIHLLIYMYIENGCMILHNFVFLIQSYT